MKTRITQKIIQLVCLLSLTGAFSSLAQNAVWTNVNANSMTWSVPGNWLSNVVANGTLETFGPGTDDVYGTLLSNGDGKDAAANFTATFGPVRGTNLVINSWTNSYNPNPPAATPSQWTFTGPNANLQIVLDLPSFYLTAMTFSDPDNTRYGTNFLSPWGYNITNNGSLEGITFVSTNVPILDDSQNVMGYKIGASPIVTVNTLVNESTNIIGNTTNGAGVVFLVSNAIVCVTTNVTVYASNVVQKGVTNWIVFNSTNGLIKQGGGILSLQANNNINGPLLINGGTYVVNGAENGQNSVAVSNGTLAVNGSLTATGSVILAGGNMVIGTNGWLNQVVPLVVQINSGRVLDTSIAANTNGLVIGSNVVFNAGRTNFNGGRDVVGNVTFSNAIVNVAGSVPGELLISGSNVTFNNAQIYLDLSGQAYAWSTNATVASPPVGGAWNTNWPPRNANGVLINDFLLIANYTGNGGYARANGQSYPTYSTNGVVNLQGVNQVYVTPVSNAFDTAPYVILTNFPGSRSDGYTWTNNTILNGSAANFAIGGGLPRGLSATFTLGTNISTILGFSNVFTPTCTGVLTTNTTFGVNTSSWVSMTISGAPTPQTSLLWKATVNSNWDTATTNFTVGVGGAADQFYNWDTVLVDDHTTAQTTNGQLVFLTRALAIGTGTFATNLLPNSTWTNGGTITTMYPVGAGVAYYTQVVNVPSGGLIVSNNTTNVILIGPGQLTGPGTLVKLGNNTLTLSNATAGATGPTNPFPVVNTYFGGTVVGGGILKMGNDDGWYVGHGYGPITISNNAILELPYYYEDTIYDLSSASNGMPAPPRTEYTFAIITNDIIIPPNDQGTIHGQFAWLLGGINRVVAVNHVIGYNSTLNIVQVGKVSVPNSLIVPSQPGTRGDMYVDWGWFTNGTVNVSVRQGATNSYNAYADFAMMGPVQTNYAFQNSAAPGGTGSYLWVNLTNLTINLDHGIAMSITRDGDQTAGTIDGTLNRFMDLGTLNGTGGTYLQGGKERTGFWRVGSKNENSTFNGQIGERNSQGLTHIWKAGTATWTLTGSNYYTGYTVISNGTLELGEPAGTLGIGARTYLYANLLLSRVAQLTLTNALWGNGTMINRGGVVQISPLQPDPAVWVNTNFGGNFIITNSGIAGMTVLQIPADSVLGTNQGGFRADRLYLDGGGLNAMTNILFTNSIDSTNFVLTANRGITVGNNNAGGWLSADPFITMTVLAPITGNGAVTITNSGVVVLAGVNTYGGATVINAGNLIITNESALGTPPGGFDSTHFVFKNGGTLRTPNDVAIGPDNIGVNLNGALSGSIQPDSGTTLTINNPIGGNGPLNMDGQGTLTLGAYNPYIGNTMVDFGTLALASGGSISNSPVIYLASGAALDVTALSGGLNLSAPAQQKLMGNGSVYGNVIGGTNTGIVPGDSPTDPDDIGTLTINGNLTMNGITNYLDLAYNGSDLVQVNGNLSLIGTNNWFGMYFKTLFNPGHYHMLHYTGTITGGSRSIQPSFLVGTRLAVTISADTVGKYIDFVVAQSGTNLVWVGNGGVNQWDVGLHGNWVYNGSSVQSFFDQLDTVHFDNSSTNKVVQIMTNLWTGNINVDAGNYVFTNGLNSPSARLGGGSSVYVKGGTLKLLTVNDYFGETVINGGAILQAGDKTLASGNGIDGTIGSGPVTNNGTLIFDENISVTPIVYGPITGSGKIQLNNGTVTFSNDNSYTGITTLSNTASLNVGVPSSGQPVGSLVGDVYMGGAGNSITFAASNTNTYAGHINGNSLGNFNIIDGGLILTSSNGFGGGATIGAGTMVQVGNGGSTGTFGGSGGNVHDNGMLIFQQNNTNLYDRTISGSGGLAQMGTGKLIINSDNGYSGATIIDTNATLQVGNGGYIGSLGTGIITNNGILSYSNSSPVLFNTNSIVGSGKVLAVLPTSSSVMVMHYGPASANTYNGGTVIGNGLVVMGNWPEASVNDVTWDGYGLGQGPVTITNNAGIAFAGSYDQLDINSTYTPVFTNDFYVPSGQTANFLSAARLNWQSIVSGSNDSVINLVIPHQRLQQYMNWSNFYGTLNVSVRSNIDSTLSLIQNGALVDYRVRGTPNMPNTRLHVDPNHPQVGMYYTGTGNWIIGELIGPNGCVLGGNSFNAGGNTTLVIGSLNSSNWMGGRIVDGETIVKVGTGPFYLSNNTNSFSGQVVITNGVMGLLPPFLGNGTPVLSNVVAISVGAQGTWDTSALGTFNYNSGFAPVGSIYDGYLLFSNRMLQGLGVITGNVVVAYGGSLSPGMRSNSMASTWLLTTNMDLNGKLTFTNSSLTFLGSSTNFLKLSGFNTADDTYGTNNDMLVVGGNLTLTNTNSLPTYIYLPNQVSRIPLELGTYKLITYKGRLDGTSTNNLRLIQRIGAALSSSTTNEIDLIVTNTASVAANLVWKGGFPGGSIGTSGQGTTNYWNLINALNWYNTTNFATLTYGSTDVFYSGDNLLFTDWYTNADGPQNPGTNSRVTVAGGTILAPGSMTVNSTNNWTFTQSWTNLVFDSKNTNGGGYITGVGGLTKTGSGTVVMLVPGNNYAGPNFLSGGMFVVTNLANYNAASPLGQPVYNNVTNLVLSNIVFRILVTNYVTSTFLSGNGAGYQSDRYMTLHGGVTFDLPFTTNITVLTPPTIGAWQTNQLTLLGTIAGDGGLTKSGGGYMVLNNNTNLYTGPTVIVPNYITYFTNVGNPQIFTNSQLTFAGAMDAFVWYATNLTTQAITTNIPGNFSLSNSSPIWVQSGARLNITTTNWTEKVANYYVMASNQVLKGAGIITGGILANDTTAISVGDWPTNCGTLTFVGGAGNCNLSNTVVYMKINRQPATGLTSDKIVANQILFGGTLNVTNMGPLLVDGDTFLLFDLCTNRLSAFATYQLPTGGVVTNGSYVTNAYYTWSDPAGNLSSYGRIVVSVSNYVQGVSPVSTTPITFGSAVTSTGTLVLSWPPDHLGWTLLSQTNPLSVGVKTGLANWYPWPGLDSTTVTNLVVPLVKTNPTVFYRLMYTNGP